MLDVLSRQRIQEVHPELANRVGRLAVLLSFDLRITQWIRTYAQQNELWQQGRNPDGSYVDPVHHTGVVTDAKGGFSAHNFAYAVDVAPIVDGAIDWNGKDAKWAEILAKATMCGLAEGAQWRSFPDEPHLYLQELPATPDDNLRSIFADGGMLAVFDEINRILDGRTLH